VVALTKIDMVGEDPTSRDEWLDLVEADLHSVLQNTILSDAPIMRVSARMGWGISELKTALSDCLAERPPRLNLSRPRLPIDRVFTIAGFGTVVTGTLLDGQLKVGDEVEILPTGLRGRVRGLQTHKQKEQIAVPGSRTAVNITGVALDELQRGQVVAHPGSYRSTQRLDVQFRLLPDASLALKHNTEVKLFIGAAEVVARVRLLGLDELAPGEQGWLQLEVVEPVVATRGDHYILRRPSPGETLGGGVVVEPHPRGRHKRFAPGTISRLEALAQGTPADVLLQSLTASGAATFKDLTASSNLDAQQVRLATQELLAAGQMLILEGDGNALRPDDLVVSRNLWEQIIQRIIHEVEAYHKAFPLRRGIPREELKSRSKDLLRPSPRLFGAVLRRLVAEGRLQESGPVVFLPGHTIRFTPQQEQAIQQLMKRFASSPYSPPPLKECQIEAGEDVVAALIDLEILVAVAPDVVFRKEDYDRMVSDVRGLIQKNGALTVAQARDHFNTSRRYVLAFLEHLDAIGVTTRQGDERKLKSL
jgi:selenocysteine-specific elongation factor